MNISRQAGWVTALAVAAILIGGGAVVAQEEIGSRGFRGPGMRGPRGEENFMQFRMLRQLDLTEDQQTAIRKLRETHFEQTEVEREGLMKARKAFQEAVQMGDETAIRDAAHVAADAEADLAIARRGFHKEFLEVLTEEQQQKMKEHQAEMEAFREERLQRREETRKKF